MLFSAVSDKEYKKMLGDILNSGLFQEVVLTQIAGERGVLARQLYETVCQLQEGIAVKDAVKKKMCCYELDIASGIDTLFTKRKQSDYIYIVGSLYLVGQVKQLLDNHTEFFGK